MQLWRQFFDPVGIRLALDKKRVKAEVYVLPMISNEYYNQLFRLSGRDTHQFDPKWISPRSLAHFTIAFNPQGWFRALGDWALVRIDDGEGLANLSEWWVKNDLVPRSQDELRNGSIAKIPLLPLTAGVGIRDPQIVQADKLELMRSIASFLRADSSKSLDYKKTPILWSRLGKESFLLTYLNQIHENLKLTHVEFYQMIFDNGWYVSFDKQALHDIIDRAIERKQKKARAETVPINASLYIAPKAAKQSAAALRQYLEWETHKRALPNNALWGILYRANLLDEKSPASAKRQAALRFLGFLPVSPDDAAYRYDAARGEVVNLRHGSLRQPKLHDTIAADSPLAGLLDQFPTLRVDLRFREDGFHSTITVERKP
ncbi:MAG: hypothetical protein FJ271_13015 [Planctomycetes bacterium]|nr:hypothetical protein [Planctomycetota bacterium]